MSVSIDDRIVKMQFDMTGFESGATKAIDILSKLKNALRLDGAKEGLDSVRSSISGFSMDPVSRSVDECSNRFRFFEDYVSGVFTKLGGMTAQFAVNMVKNATVKPVVDGLHEYETQMTSIQTILSNSGEKLKAAGITNQEEQIEVINQKLDELNTYADKTIYNFSEMTRNIGTFTAAGVDLDTATESIQGIANLAAASGSSSQQASTAMYQLSQAIAAGSLKLQDWNSVVNAGMGGELFQEALKRTARAHGIAVDEMIEKNGSFRESLQEGWITSDVLTDTLGQLAISYEKVGDEAYNTAYAQLKQQGYSDEDAKSILELAKNAEDAATKVRTWTQLWDTVGEALGSGWASTWRTIIGDFLQATELFTYFSNSITNMINASSDARNAVLQQWADANNGAGRKSLVDSVKNLYQIVAKPLRSIARAFSSVFSIGAEQLYNFTTGLATFTSKFVLTNEQCRMLRYVFTDIFRIIHSVISVLVNVGKIIFNVFSAAWRIIKPFVTEIASVFAILLNAIARASEIVAFFGEAFETVSWYVFVGLFDMLASAISSVVDAFKKTAIFKAVASVFEKISSVVTTVSDALSKVFDWLTKVREIDFGSGLVQYTKIQEIVETISSRFSHFVEGFKASDDKIAYIGQSLFGVFDKLRNAISTLFDVLEDPSKIVDVLSNLEKGLMGSVGVIFSDDTELRKQMRKIIKGAFNPLIDFFNESTKDAENWSQVFDNVVAGVCDRFSKYFAMLPQPVQDALISIKNFGVELFKQGKNWITSTTIFQTISKTFKKYFGSLGDHIPSLEQVRDKVIGIFDSIANYFKGITVDKLFGDISGKIGEVATKISDKFNFLTAILSGAESVGKVTGKSSFGIIFEGILKTLENSLMKLSPKFGSLFATLVSSIGTGAGRIKDELGKLSFKNVITNLSNFGDFVSKLPSKIANGFQSIATSVVNFFKKFPFPSFDQLSKIGETLLKGGLAVSLIQLIQSFKGLNKTFSGLGKGIIDWPKNFGNALEKFGEGFNSWRKETKADAVVKIAKALLIMAGALFIIASLPADDLIRAGKAVGIMAAGIAGLFVIFGLLDKFKVIDSEAIANIGAAIGGIGVGVLALAGACLILSQIPVEDIGQGLLACVFLILACAAYAKGLDSNGSSLLKGSIGMVIFAGALGLMVKVAKSMQDIKLDKLNNGLWALIALIGALTVFGHFAAEQIGNLLSSFLKFGAGMILLAASVGVLAVSLILLSGAMALIGDNWAVFAVAAGFIIGFTVVCYKLKDADPAGVAKAFVIFGASLIVLAGALFILAQIPFANLLAGAGAIAALVGGFALITAKLNPDDLKKTALSLVIFSAAVGVISASLWVLSTVPWTQIAASAVAMGALIGIFAGVAQIDAEKLNSAAIALIGFSAALVVMSGAFYILGSINLESFIPAFVALVVVLAGLAAISGAGAQIGMGMAAISAGIGLFGISLIALSAGLNAMNNVDYGLMISNIQMIANSALEAGRNILDGLRNALANAPAELVHLAFDMASNFVQAFKDELGIASPSTVMEENGEFAVDGLINGVLGKLSEILGVGEQSGDSLLSGLDGLPSDLGTKASEALNTFLENFDLDKVKTMGVDLLNGMIDGVSENLESKLREVAHNVFFGWTDPIKEFFGIASPSTYMRDTIGKNVLQGLIDGLQDGSLLSSLGGIATTIGNTISNGIGWLTGAIGGLADGVGSAFTSTLGSYAPKAGAQAGLVASSVTSAMDSTVAVGATSAIKTATGWVTGLGSQDNQIKSKSKAIKDNTINPLKSLANDMRTQGRKGVDAFVKALASGAGSARSATRALMNGARSGLGSLRGSFHQVGYDAGIGFANGINNTSGHVYRVAYQLGVTAIQAAKRATKEHSPSKVFHEIGYFVGEGFILGMKSEIPKTYKMGTKLAETVPTAFENTLSALSLNIDDLLETDYNPVITPVINSTEFDSGMYRLSSAINSRLGDISVGNLNYTGELSSQLSDYNDINRRAIDLMASNTLDYNLLGVAVANALINAGVHVEMDGGQLMGYLAGEISDARRMYGTR